jgi:ATP-dependent RNA helicase RhlE
MSFLQLGITKELASRCAAKGFENPTPVQQQAIPVVLGGGDLIACAPTGTGKTAAFLLPILQHYKPTMQGTRVLILSPTRELALQIETNFRSLVGKKRAECVSLIGGDNMSRQITSLRKGVYAVIATPGRLMDHLERRTVDLSQIDVLVLDEADRMLDMGFWPTIRTLINLLPSERQTLLFSATMSNEIEKLARTTMKSPALIEIGVRNRAATTVNQKAYPVALESKTALLLDILETQSYERVLVFTRTRRGAERLAHILSARDHKVNRIHADRSQGQRESALRGFKDGNHKVLIATDIAARGIDVEMISHVVNFDVPAAPEDYVHRIGRTGRAGAEGCAITLVTQGEELSIKAIERHTGQKIERVMIPGFGGVKPLELTKSPAFKHIRGTTRSFRPRRAGR